MDQSCFNFAVIMVLLRQVVVLSTLGYGDLLPTNDWSKIYTVFFMTFAITVPPRSAIESRTNATYADFVRHESRGTHEAIV